MVEPLVELEDILTEEDIKAIPDEKRAVFVESMILKLINANSNRGVTLTDLVGLTNYSKNSVIKALDVLYTKRKISKIALHKSIIYFPNGRLISNFKEINYESDRSLSFKILEKDHKYYLYLLERELDERGILQDAGGIMISFFSLPDVNRIISEILQDKKIREMTKCR